MDDSKGWRIRSSSISVTGTHESSDAIASEKTDDRTTDQAASNTQQVGFMKRTFSFQFGRPKEALKLDAETSAMIKLRYKDISKFVIWPDCLLPEEYNRGYLTFNPDRKKRTALRYSHAGNHQAAILRLKNQQFDDSVKYTPISSPKTFPRPKSHNRPITASPAHTIFASKLSTLKEEEKTQKHAPSSTMANRKASNVVDIEDDQTPLPKRIINSIRRSDSSDEDEPIINITASINSDQCEFEQNLRGVHIWRF